MPKHTLRLDVTVEVDINNPNVVDRCVNDEDGWRSYMYDFRTEEDVLKHLAYNCVANGIGNLRMMDGWADLDPEDATMRVVDVESW